MPEWSTSVGVLTGDAAADHHMARLPPGGVALPAPPPWVQVACGPVSCRGLPNFPECPVTFLRFR